MKKTENSLKDPLFRLQKYYIYFSNKDFTLDDEIEEGCSIVSLQKHLRLPVGVLRRDIALLLSMPEKGYIWFDSDEVDIDNIPNDKLRSGVIRGLYDDVPIISALPFYYTEADVPVPMKETEKELLSGYLQSVFNGREPQDAGYVVKQSYRFHHTEALTERILTLNEAINASCAVRMRYRDPRKKNELTIEIFPVRLLYDATDNIYSVVAACEEFRHLYTYRLDRMIYVSANRGNIWDPEASKHKELMGKLKYAPIIWDGNYDSADPVHVKVSFQNTGNVWDKVKQDLVYRTNGILFESEADIFGKKEKVLVYEDDVSGMNSFRSWVSGYGRSAYVHEPEVLRDSIVSALKKQVENYKWTNSDVD